MSSPLTQEMPPESQELLLQAIIFNDQRRKAAWEKWREKYSMEEADYETARFFSSLYIALAGSEQCPEMQILRGIYKRNLLKNRVLFRTCSLFIQSLQEAGINVMLLKGAASAVAYPDSIGFRFMRDLDLLVTRSQRLETIDIFRKHNWKVDPGGWSLEEGLDKYHSISFFSKTSSEIDLHWNLFNSWPKDTVNNLVWRDAQTVEFEDIEVLVPSATCMFGHACIHGTLQFPEQTYWVLDVIRIGEHADWDLDWDFMIHFAKEAMALSKLRCAFGYLVKTIEAPIPESVISDVMSTPSKKYEKFSCTVEGMNPSNIKGLLLRVSEYIRISQARNVFSFIYGFPNYLNRYWSAKPWWQFPWHFLIYGMAAVMRWIKHRLISLVQ